MAQPESYETVDDGARVNTTDTPIETRIEWAPREGEPLTAVDAGP